MEFGNSFCYNFYGTYDTDIYRLCTMFKECCTINFQGGVYTNFTQFIDSFKNSGISKFSHNIYTIDGQILDNNKINLVVTGTVSLNWSFQKHSFVDTFIVEQNIFGQYLIVNMLTSSPA